MPKGGSRRGAGRKPNTGMYRERTIVKRVPSVTARLNCPVYHWIISR